MKTWKSGWITESASFFSLSNSHGKIDPGHWIDLLLLSNPLYLLTDQSEIGSDDDSSSVYGEQPEAVLRLLDLLRSFSRSDHG